MTEKKAHLRGVNDIMTRMNLPGSRCTKAQQANLLARLEHQKALLEKQLDIWRKQQGITERRLRLVQAQIRTAELALDVAKSAPHEVAKPARSAGVRTLAAAFPRRHNNFEFSF